MNVTTNATVITPLGKGTVQGKVIGGWMVRLPINDTTRPHLQDANCDTPHAGFVGTWTFAEDQLTEAKK